MIGLQSLDGSWQIEVINCRSMGTILVLLFYGLVFLSCFYGGRY